MLKRRTQDEANPTDNVRNYCGWDDYRGSRRLRRAGTHPRNARGKQLARDPSLLLLLVVPRVQKVLRLLWWGALLSPQLSALPVPL